MSRPSLRDRIVKRLGVRTELERGEAARIARALGCSRERVGQVMRQLGITVAPPSAPERCVGCGKPKRHAKTRLCRACRRAEDPFVTLTCANCGKNFRRRRSRHDAYLRRTVVRKRYGPVCSRKCSAKVQRSCSWCGQPTAPRWPNDLGKRAFCGAPRSCSIEAQRALPAMFWGYLTPGVLPMKAHLEAIAQLRATIKARRRRRVSRH